LEEELSSDGEEDDAGMGGVARQNFDEMATERRGTMGLDYDEDADIEDADNIDTNEEEEVYD
jgi:hypothetical protein